MHKHNILQVKFQKGLATCAAGANEVEELLL